MGERKLPHDEGAQSPVPIPTPPQLSALPAKVPSPVAGAGSTAMTDTGGLALVLVFTPLSLRLGRFWRGMDSSHARENRDGQADRPKCSRALQPEKVAHQGQTSPERLGTWAENFSASPPFTPGMLFPIFSPLKTCSGSPHSGSCQVTSPPLLPAFYLGQAAAEGCHRHSLS